MGELLQNYLNKQQTHEQLIAVEPENNLQLIVIIPAYNEPEILKTLVSLKNCSPAKFPTEVIILINHCEATPSNIIEQNNNTYLEVNEWIKRESTPSLKFHCIIKPNFPEKHAGVGLARKTLMDEAIRRFAFQNNTMGIIASFDADSLVSINYLCDIQQAFVEDIKLNCATFWFEHQMLNEISNENKNAIVLYELYLRYFKLALVETGFPYAFHTVGSCFAVRALAYAKQGGMSKRQAGEDFYFLHKIFPLGNCAELNHIVVYPSSRPSDRVPFGTGNAVQKILENHEFLTYNPIYFKYLKFFFKSATQLYKADTLAISANFSGQDASIQAFINLDEFIKKVLEFNSNCASEEKFIHRFYQWFDAFKIIKYLNFVHNIVPRISVADAVPIFFNLQNMAVNTKEPMDLLIILKELELNNTTLLSNSKFRIVIRSEALSSAPNSKL